MTNKFDYSDMDWERDYKNICRICYKESDIMISVFEEAQNVENIQLLEMIEECASVTVAIHDDVSILLCYECADQLETCYQFRKKCLKSELFFKELIKRRYIKHPDLKSTYDLSIEDTPIVSEKSITEPVEIDTNSSDKNQDSIVNLENVNETPIRQETEFHTNFELSESELCELIENSNNENISQDFISTYLNTSQNDLYYFCDVCECRFNKVNSLRIHLNIMHSDIKKIKCSICSLIFSLDAYITHRIYNYPCICSRCKLEFDDEIKYRDHCIEYHNATFHSCPHCKKNFLQILEKIYHLSVCHQIVCKLCPEKQQYSTKFELISHLSSFHGVGDIFESCLCDAVFVNQQTLKAHLQRNHQTECKICLKFFDTKAQCQQHCSTKHSVSKFNNRTIPCIFTCNICSKQINSKASMQKHIRINHIKCVYYENCFQYFGSVIDCAEHLTDYHGEEKSYLCYICNMLFESERVFNQHMEMHPIKCYYCPLYFKDLVTRRIHVKTQHDDQKLKCDYCNSRFRLPSLLEVHTKTVHEFKCCYCLQPCNDKEALDEHKEVAHSNDQSCICYKCGLKCNSKIILLNHVKGHDKEWNYICEQCGKGFVHIAQLKYHTNRHNGNKRYKCSICEKRFYRKNQLTSHLEIHETNRETQCNECGIILFKSNLDKHLLTHQTKEKIHQCKICDKSFLRSDTLKMHIQAHLDDSQYVCKFCNEVFVRRSELYEHRHQMHPEKIIKIRKPPKIQCTVCNKILCSRAVLKKHMRRRHLQYLECDEYLDKKEDDTTMFENDFENIKDDKMIVEYLEI